jgi:hypothetical protein
MNLREEENRGSIEQKLGLDLVDAHIQVLK